MKASFESVKFSVRRCRCGRGGHWQARGPLYPLLVAPLLACVITSVTSTRPGLGGTIIFVMGPHNAAPKTSQDTLSSYFDDSAAAVRQTFSRCAPQSPITPVHSSPTLCQIRKRIRSSHCRPHKVPLYGVSDIFCEFFERFANHFHLIQSAAVGYRFSSRPLPFSAYFLFSHSCMSLL